MTDARGFAAFPARRGGRFAATWWGRAWLRAMEDTALDVEQLRRGRRYARAGLVGPITVSSGRIGAAVRDHDDLHHTELRLAPLTDTEWDRLLEQVAARSGYIAALLDRDMPRELADAAADVGVALLPGIGDLDPQCDCPGWELPCKHAAALAYQTAWLLDADPFVLLLLRGRTERQVLDAVQARHVPVAAEHGVAAVEAFARPVPGLPDDLPSLVYTPPDLPEADGVEVAALGLLAADAAARATMLLDGETPPTDAWADAVRMVATHTNPAMAQRLHTEGIERAAEAWRLGGDAGLRALERDWQAPAARLNAARTALVAAEFEAPIVSGNRLTVGRAQLRLGRDDRWYPFRLAGDEWWPAGPPAADPVTALSTVESE